MHPRKVSKVRSTQHSSSVQLERDIELNTYLQAAMYYFVYHVNDTNDEGNFEKNFEHCPKAVRTFSLIFGKVPKIA